jgi:hypothetical protein
MRKITFGLLFGIFILVGIVNIVSAEVQQGFMTEVILKQGSSINMGILEGYCSPQYCTISDTVEAKQITFKINYEDRDLIFTAKQNKKNDFYSLFVYDKSPKFVADESDIASLKSTVSIGLRLLKSNDVISLSKEDIDSITNLVKSGVVIYYKESSCGDSYFKGFDENGDLGESGWLASKGDRCSFNGYKNECSSLTCCGDNLRGELIVGFKDGLTKIDVENLTDFYNLSVDSWSSPDFTYAKIKVLSGNREDYIPLLEAHPRIGKVKIVNGSSNELLIYFYIPDFKNLKLEEVKSIISEFENIELVQDEIYDKFMKVEYAVVKVPEGEESQWKSTLEGNEIVKYVGLNGISCTASEVGISIPDVTSLLSLPLKKGISEGEDTTTPSTLIYWIIGIVGVIAVIILVLFLMRKKK